MPDWFIAVNRSAGKKSIDPSVVEEMVRETGVTAEVIAPDSISAMEDAIADAASAGRSRIAVVGGDGTLNLAINTVLGLGLDDPPTMAVLPTGTGCDILRTFGLSQELGEVARHLATPNTYVCDVVLLDGSWGTRYFLNVAQAGVGAAAAETAPKLSRRLGAVRYPLAFGVRLPRFPKATVRVTTDKRVYESEALAVIVANAQFFAGGWNVAPKANLVDGLVDIQIINAHKTQAPALVPKVIKGTHLREPSVRRTTTAQFTIETEPAWPVEADGDLVGNTTVRGRVVPAAIRLKI